MIINWLRARRQRRAEKRKIREQEELIFKLKNPNYRRRPAAK